MLIPETWFWWGIGWLLMPRMTIGILLMIITPYHDLGLLLAIIGALFDIGNNSRITYEESKDGF